MYTNWRKASASANNANCIEVAGGQNTIGVRDSKLSSSPVLDFPIEDWHHFLDSIKHN